MSDARLRELERQLAADPTPAARDALAAARTRAGDGPWLPALDADETRWRRVGQTERLLVSLALVGVKPRHDAWRGFPGISAQLGALRDLDVVVESSVAAWSRAWVDPMGEAEAFRALVASGLATPAEASRMLREGDPVSLAVERTRRYGPPLVLRSTSLATYRRAGSSVDVSVVVP